MAKTTIYIALTVGAQLPAYPASVAFRSPWRFVSGNTVVLPEPAPVLLARDGTGVIAVDPGVWLVDEILPTQTIRRAVVVPEAETPIPYSSLAEVTDPAELGYAPTWAAAVLAAAVAAQASAAEAVASVADLGDPIVLGVLDHDETPPFPGIFLRRPEPSGEGGVGPVPTVLLGSPLSAATQPQAGNLTITPAAGTLVGDRVVVAVSAADSASANYAMSGGSGEWTTLLASGSVGTGKLFIFSKIFAAGDTTYNLSRVGSDAYRVIPITARGSSTTAPVVGVMGTRAASGGTTKTTAPTIDTVTPNSLALYIAMERTTADDGAATINNGFTINHDAHTIGGDNLQALLVASKAMATPGAVGATTATFTNSHATNSAAVLIAIPPKATP